MRYRSLRARNCWPCRRAIELLAMLPTNVSDFDELDADEFDAKLVDIELIATEMMAINDAQLANLEELGRH